MPISVRAEYESIEVIGRSMRDTADDMRSLLMRIYFHLSTLQSGGWLGEAADRFYDEMDSFFIPWLKQLETLYEDMGDSTLRLLPIFQNADDHVGRYFETSGSPGMGADSAVKFFNPTPRLTPTLDIPTTFESGDPHE